MFFRIEKYKKCEISKEKILEGFNGFNAYAKWADSFKLRRRIIQKIYKQQDLNICFS